MISKYQKEIFITRCKISTLKKSFSRNFICLISFCQNFFVYLSHGMKKKIMTLLLLVAEVWWYFKTMLGISYLNFEFWTSNFKTNKQNLIITHFNGFLFLSFTSWPSRIPSQWDFELLTYKRKKAYLSHFCVRIWTLQIIFKIKPLVVAADLVKEKQ